MASQRRTYSKKKLLGQVYTPQHIVDRILALTSFHTDHLPGKSLLDPACGDGRFLVRVVEHILEVTPREQVANALQNIHGWDIDSKAINACRANLDALIAPLGIQVSWNLRRCDALKRINTKQRFDYIVGNPPYIRIQHLQAAQRAWIQTHYRFCASGSTDAYIAFFELASKLLHENGKCGLITPNSFLISDTGALLRAHFESNQNLLHLTNYGIIPVFGSTGTYAAVTIFGRQRQPAFRFEQCINRDYTYEGRDINFDEIKDTPAWHLSVNATAQTDGQRLGDICSISVGLTTLADRLYLFTITEDLGNVVLARSKSGIDTIIEKGLLKPVIKGSKLKTAADPVTEYILFPYQKDATGRHRIISEDELKATYPQSFSYLLKVKSELDRRDNGKPNVVAWYAFGRAQGLDHVFGRKIIFSPMNRYPNFVLYENPDVMVYSGYFIKYDGDYQALLNELNSQRMADFISVAGRDFQGGYKGYNKKAIENFIVPVEATAEV